MFLICQADPVELLDHAAVDEVAPGSIGTWAPPNARNLRLVEPEPTSSPPESTRPNPHSDNEDRLSP